VTDLKKLTSGYGSEMQRHWDQILWPGGGSAVVIAVIPVTGTKGSPVVYYRGKSSGWINGVIVNKKKTRNLYTVIYLRQKR